MKNINHVNHEFLTTRAEITAWLDQYKIENYSLVPDKQYGFVVEVEGDVYLGKRNFSWIPVKFKQIKGDLLCYGNQLTSLEFCPTMVGGDFFCDNNQLTTLEFCPENVNSDFDCTSNQLTSLEFCPTNVGDNFNCDFNLLASLEHCPKIIGGSFSCAHNQLTSLEFCPTSVGGNFNCAENNISSLEFCTQIVKGYFYCFGNPALGDAQKARNFTQILNLHKETLIEKEKENLDKQLYRPQISEASSSFKI